MIKVNGAKLDWQAYEFGCEYVSDVGEYVGVGAKRKTIVVNCGTKEHAEELAKFHNGKVKFRAVYVTEWMDTL